MRMRFVTNAVNISFTKADLIVSKILEQYCFCLRNYSLNCAVALELANRDLN